MLDGGYSYVEFPGERLLKGTFSSYGLDYDVDGAVAVGLRDGRLVMAPANGGSECDAGGATDFVLAGYYGVGLEHRAYVPFLESKDEQGRGPLRFADHQCTSPLESAIPDSELPLYTGFADELPRHFMLGAEGEEPFRDFRSLIECSLWNEPVSCKTSSVKQLTLQDQQMWRIELDLQSANSSSAQPTKLVANERFTTVAVEVAAEVGELAATQTDVAFIDSSGLNLLDSQGYFSIQLLEPDACSLHSLQGPGTSAYSYFAPCQSEQLVVFDPATEQRFELASGGQPPVWLGPILEGGRHALYQSELKELPPPTSASSLFPELGSWNRFAHVAPSAAPYRSGTLWAERLGSNEPVRGPERALLGSLQWQHSTRVRVLAGFDGRVGRLVEWDVESGELVEIASGVVDFGADWALADFDGQAGNLLEVSASLTTRIIAQGVAARPSKPRFGNGCLAFCDSQTEAEANAALLTDYDGTTGTLRLFSRPGLASHRKSEVIAYAVPKEGYQMLSAGDAVVYIEDYSADAQTGRLQVRFLNTADTFSVDGVASFYEVTWPDPGLLYAIPEGRNAGVWYARLR